jgi:hypothetical protein
MVFSAISTIFQLYILEVSFIGGRDQRARRKPPTCRKFDIKYILRIYFGLPEYIAEILLKWR